MAATVLIATALVPTVDAHAEPGDGSLTDGFAGTAATSVDGAAHASTTAEVTSSHGAAQRGSTAETIDRVLITWDTAGSVRQRDDLVADLADAGLARSPERSRVTATVESIEVEPARLTAATAWLDSSDLTAIVQPDHPIHLEAAPERDAPGVGSAAAPSTERDPAQGDVSLVGEPTGDATPARPDDPLFVQQWGLVNEGQAISRPDGSSVDTVAGVDMRVLEAWAMTRGAPEVTVAVIDTMLEETHPDLDGAVVEQLPIHPRAEEGERLHGTSVASVIAARADDGFGMAGVAPEVSVLGLGAFYSDGSGPGSSEISYVLQAFEAAAAAGADVINASWTTQRDDPLLLEAVALAEVPVVVASGNNGRLLTEGASVFPAAYDLPNLVTVTAVDAAGGVPGFANVGSAVVDVAAPGKSILGAVPDGRQHAFADGTSMAAPMVAGALALAIAAQPDASTRELVDAVAWTSRAQRSLASLTRSSGLADASALLRGLHRPLCPRSGSVPAGFPDVLPTNTHAQGIDCITAAGLARGKGDGTYAPQDTVTRAQMATFVDALLRRAGEPEPEVAGGTFSDVAPDDVHAPAIERLAARGIVRGHGDGRFRPDAQVSRGQIATFLTGAYVELTGDEPAPTRRWFADTDESVHVDSIDRARDLGIVRGIDRFSFDPQWPTRRGQMASLLANTMDALGRAGIDL